jgi:hypothetical protein
MAALLIVLGLLFGLFGGCNLLQAIVDTNQARSLGGAIIGIVLLVPGLLMFIYGVKMVGGIGQYEKVSVLRRDDQAGCEGVPVLRAGSSTH